VIRWQINDDDDDDDDDDMAAKTGNTCISRTMVDSTETPMANPGFSSIVQQKCHQVTTTVMDNQK